MSHVILNQASPIAALPKEFYTFFLPWLFTFAIVYGLIVKAKIFGDKNDRIAAVLGLVIAFFTTALAGPAMANFFITLSASASMVLAGILVIILFIAMVSDKFMKTENVAVIGILVLLGIFIWLSASGSLFGISIDDTTATLLFWGFIILAAVWYLMKETGQRPAAGGQTT